MQKFGIDISKWQGDFSIAQAMLSAGVEFVIIKCGGSDKGVYKDPRFEENYKKAKEVGIPVGAYWFSKAMTVDEAKRDALFCLELLKHKQFELPIYIDVENKQQLAVGRDKLTSIIDAFLSILEDNRYYAGIYSSRSYFQTYMDDNYLQKYTHWIASWGTAKPAGAGIWQFGGETNKLRSNKINGQTVDQDYMFVDFPTIIKQKGLNGYTAREVNERENTIKNHLTQLIDLGYTKEEISSVLERL